MIEIVLALAVLVLIAGVVSVTMFGSASTYYLDEGSRQFETVIRLARAEAATQGRRFRLSFDAEPAAMKVQWEPQPLAQPGQFADFSDASWVESLPAEYVRVVSSRKIGSDAYETLVFGQPKKDMGKDAATLDAIEFFPDASFDSAIIELASTDEKDPRRAVVRLDGVNQLITTQIMLAEEVVELYAQMGLETEK